MKEYSVRVKYTDASGLITRYNDQQTKPLKFTLDDARDYAKDLINRRDDVDYCKIYKGRTFIEKIEK